MKRIFSVEFTYEGTDDRDVPTLKDFKNTTDRFGLTTHVWCGTVIKPGKVKLIKETE
jgi:hypothetical protein